MKAFTTLTSTFIPLPNRDVDTDQIIPAVYLKVIDKDGLVDGLFSRWRYLPDGSPDPEFVINKPEYQHAEILLAGDNFGCGSSREHAPWALLDFGIRCVIAPSFADIFYNNSFKNGILPIELPQEQVAILMDEAEANPEAPLEIDLTKQTIKRGNTVSFDFDIDPARKHSLLNGLDDIGLTLEKKAHIVQFETHDKQKRSWLY